MPYGEPDATDPMELVGHAMPDDPGALDRMAEAVVDEYVRVGFGAEQLMPMFRDPFYALMHSIWCERGDAWCAALVERTAAQWRR